MLAIFGTALQLPPIHEPPQQGRPMLARFCFSDEATTVFALNLLQSRFMAFSPFLPIIFSFLLRQKIHHGFSFNFIDPKSNLKK